MAVADATDEGGVPMRDRQEAILVLALCGAREAGVLSADAQLALVSSQGGVAVKFAMHDEVL